MDRRRRAGGGPDLVWEADRVAVFVGATAVLEERIDRMLLRGSGWVVPEADVPSIRSALRAGRRARLPPPAPPTDAELDVDEWDAPEVYPPGPWPPR